MPAASMRVSSGPPISILDERGAVDTAFLCLSRQGCRWRTSSFVVTEIHGPSARAYVGRGSGGNVLIIHSATRRRPTGLRMIFEIPSRMGTPPLQSHLWSGRLPARIASLIWPPPAAHVPSREFPERAFHQSLNLILDCLAQQYSPLSCTDNRTSMNRDQLWRATVVDPDRPSAHRRRGVCIMRDENRILADGNRDAFCVRPYYAAARRSYFRPACSDVDAGAETAIALEHVSRLRVIRPRRVAS
jgi:hypothetical protein